LQTGWRIVKALPCHESSSGCILNVISSGYLLAPIDDLLLIRNDISNSF